MIAWEIYFYNTKWDKIISSIYILWFDFTHISEFYFSYLLLNTFYTIGQSIGISFIKSQSTCIFCQIIRTKYILSTKFDNLHYEINSYYSSLFQSTWSPYLYHGRYIKVICNTFISTHDGRWNKCAYLRKLITGGDRESARIV